MQSPTPSVYLMIHQVHYINEEGREKKSDSGPQQGGGEKCKFSSLLWLPQTDSHTHTQSEMAWAEFSARRSLRLSS